MHEQCRRQRDERSLLTPEQRLKDVASELEDSRKRLRDAERMVTGLRYELDAKRSALSTMEMDGVDGYSLVGGESSSSHSYAQNGGFNNNATRGAPEEEEEYHEEYYEDDVQYGEGSGSYGADEEDEDGDTEMEEEESEEHEQNYHYSQQPSSSKGYDPKTVRSESTRPIKGSKRVDRTRVAQVGRITTC